MDNLIFLKLGGSLITDKERPRSPRLDRLEDLCGEIASVLARDPNLPLLIGHGSGSFGHIPAKKYGTREGLPTSPSPLTPLPEGEGNSHPYWHGFTEVWHEAATLNNFVMDALRAANIPAMAMAPSGSVIARDGQVAAWDLRPLRSTLQNGIVPVVYGDAVSCLSFMGMWFLTRYAAGRFSLLRICLCTLRGKCVQSGFYW